jgi:hypothetical protein
MNLEISFEEDFFAWKFLESQFLQEKGECRSCVHYKNGWCELPVCSYERKEIPLYYLAR